MAGEVLLYAPASSREDTPPVDAVRGSVFTLGLVWMRKHGVADRYESLLPADTRVRAMSLTAAEWVPLDVAMIAYRACDALSLPEDEQIDLGRAVASGNNGVVVSTVQRLLGAVASPWEALRHVDKAWRRSNRGGAVAVYKLGERQARLDFWRCPLAASRFFVTSMRGAIASGIEPFCKRLMVYEVAELGSPQSFSLRLIW